MVIHYSIAPERVACGRNGASLNFAEDKAQVTCKRCLQVVNKQASAPVRKTPSLAELRAAAKAAKSETVMCGAASSAPKAGVRQSTQAVKQVAFTASVRNQWLQHLQQLSSASRLPRGFKPQAVV